MEIGIRERVCYAEIKLLLRCAHGDITRQLEVRRPGELNIVGIALSEGKYEKSWEK